jgi:transposase-like protein
MSAFSTAIFRDEAEAHRYVEAQLWPDGPVCPHCSSIGRSGRLGGSSTRFGTYKCYECRRPFTVKIGTIFESSHVQLHLWLRAIHLLGTGDGTLPSGQLPDVLGVTRKTAAFMAQRIRTAMERDSAEGVSIAFDAPLDRFARPNLDHSLDDHPVPGFVEDRL